MITFLIAHRIQLPATGLAGEGKIMTETSLKEILDKHRETIMKVPGVIGVGVGLSPSKPGKKCILVYMTGDERPEELPERIEGVDVEMIKKTKDFRAL